MARVAPATVYATSGGKQGLLCTLTETATTDPAIEAAIESIEELDDPPAILRLVAATVRSMQEQLGDVVRVLLNTAPHDKAVCESLAIAVFSFHYLGACRQRALRGTRRSQARSPRDRGVLGSA